jgi:hypothetical protein
VASPLKSAGSEEKVLAADASSTAKAANRNIHQFKNQVKPFTTNDIAFF